MRKRKVLYVDNNNNFYLYLEVAKSSLMDWYFLVFDKDKKEKCEKVGIKCFLMSKIVAGDKSRYNVVKFLEYNKQLLNLSLSSDRILRKLPEFIAKKILISQLSKFSEVINVVCPNMVVGEISWANEYMFYKYSEFYSIPYRHLLNLPGSENRVVLFDAEHSYESLVQNVFNVKDGAKISYEELCQKVKCFNFQKKKIDLHKILKWLNVKQQFLDYRILQIYWKLSLLSRKAYYFFEKFVLSLSFLDEQQIKNIAKKKKLIYFPLHIQPESTPDFVSPEYSNQLELIKKISKVLPADYVLVVKDHPNAISFRNPVKLLMLCNKANVVFSKRSVNSKTLIVESSHVITVAGTAAMEAVSLGKPATVFSNIFYSQSMFVSRAKDINDLLHALNSGGALIYEDIDFSKYGAEAFVHDPQIVPEVLEENNVKVISRVIDQYVARC